MNEEPQERRVSGTVSPTPATANAQQIPKFPPTSAGDARLLCYCADVECTEIDFANLKGPSTLDCIECVFPDHRHMRATVESTETIVSIEKNTQWKSLTLDECRLHWCIFLYA